MEMIDLKFKKIFSVIVIICFMATLAGFAQTASSGRSTVTARSRDAAATAKKQAPATKQVRRYSSRRKSGAVPKTSGRSRGSSGKHYGSTYQVPQIEMQADPNIPILYFYPLDRLVEAGGKSFSTLIILSNPEGQTFNHVFLAIKYAPKILEPVDYEDRIPKELLMSDPEVLVFSDEGVITYSVELKEPTSLPEDELLSIKWKPLRPRRNSTLSIIDYNNRESGLFRNSINILGEPGNKNDGAIPANISVVRKTVIPEEFELPENVGVEEEIDLIADRVNVISGTGEGTVRLSLIGPEGPVKKGDIFLVNIYFENPKAMYIDNVNLDIRFDPNVLQVVDHDEENWITRDVNILDGEYHEIFPFDYHFKNRAYNQTGRIFYKMGLSSGDSLYNDGTMATIRFYAVAPAEKTSIYFYRLPDLREIKGTTLTYLGKDVIGSSDDPFKGLQNLSVHILEQ